MGARARRRSKFRGGTSRGAPAARVKYERCPRRALMSTGGRNLPHSGTSQFVEHLAAKTRSRRPRQHVPSSSLLRLPSGPRRRLRTSRSRPPGRPRPGPRARRRRDRVLARPCRPRPARPRRARRPPGRPRARGSRRSRPGPRRRRARRPGLGMTATTYGSGRRAQHEPRSNVSPPPPTHLARARVRLAMVVATSPSRLRFFVRFFLAGGAAAAAARRSTAAVMCAAIAKRAFV